MGRPLAGRSVLVTRNPGEWPGLLARLESLGAVVTFRSPTIQAPPSDPSGVEAAAARLDAYDWIVFTSGNGARYFAEAAARVGMDLASSPVRIAVVGAGTARAVRSALGRGADLTSEAGTGRALGRELAARLRREDRVLVVRPEVAARGLRDALVTAGASFDEVIGYRTLPAPWAADLARSVACGDHDVVVFTAPSSVRAILDADPTLREKVVRGLSAARRMAIGPSTAEALEEASLPADAVAPRPDEEAVAERIVAMAPRRRDGGPVC